MLLPFVSHCFVFAFFSLLQHTNINSPWSALSGTRWRRLSQSFPWSTFPGMWLAQLKSQIRIPSRWSSKMCVCIYTIHVCMSGGISLHLSLSSPPSLSLSLKHSDTACCSPSSTSRFWETSWWLQGRKSVTRAAWKTSQPTTATSVMWVTLQLCERSESMIRVPLSKVERGVSLGYQVAQLTPFYTSNWQIHPRRCCLCCFSFPSVLHTCKLLCNPPLL